MNSPKNQHQRINASLRVAAVFAVGYLLGQTNSSEHAVEAQQRETKPRTAFLSGSERSEIILKSMETTLKNIDQRLVNIEKSTATLASRSLKQ